MIINNMQYFIDIIDTGSISAAARKNYIAQQSMSAYLKKLEEHYCAQLVIRKHPLLPTEHGKKLYEVARKIDRMLAEFESELSEDDSPLVIGLMNSGVPAFIAAILAELNVGRTTPLKIRLCPNCHLSTQTENIDIYIGEEPSHEHYDVIRLVEDRLAAVISEDLLSECFGQNAEKVKQEFLATGSLSLLKKVPFSIANDVPEMDPCLPELNIVMRSDNYALLNSMCLQGKSGSFLWMDCAIREFSENNKIMVVPVSDVVVNRTLCIYMDKGYVPNAIARRFIKAAKRYFGKA